MKPIQECGQPGRIKERKSEEKRTKKSRLKEWRLAERQSYKTEVGMHWTSQQTGPRWRASIVVNLDGSYRTGLVGESSMVSLK